MQKTPQDSDGWVEEHNSLTRRNIPRVDPQRSVDFPEADFTAAEQHAISGLVSVPFVAYHWGGSRDAPSVAFTIRRVGLDDGRRVAAGVKTLAKYGLEMNPKPKTTGKLCNKRSMQISQAVAETSLWHEW